MNSFARAWHQFHADFDPEKLQVPINKVPNTLPTSSKSSSAMLLCLLRPMGCQHQRTQIICSHSRRKASSRLGHQRSSVAKPQQPSQTAYHSPGGQPSPKQTVVTAPWDPLLKEIFKSKPGGLAPFLGESCCCRRVRGGGRDTANGKRGGNEEQMCRCLEYPR